MLNNFEKICKRLDEYNWIQETNNYIRAKKAVEYYVENDRNKLMELKAETQEGDFYSFGAFLLSEAAFGISVITTIGDNILEQQSELHQAIWSLICILSVSIIGIDALRRIVKFKGVYKWRKYIVLVIEELETELKE